MTGENGKGIIVVIAFDKINLRIENKKNCLITLVLIN